MRLLLVLGGFGLLGLAGLTAPANAALHDFCWNGGSDAANVWPGARPVSSGNCNGEMLLGLDSRDWYLLDVKAGATASHAHVDLCPLSAKTAPWNPDIMVYFLPGGSALPFVQDPWWQIIIDRIVQSPGPNVASSSNLVGCDSVHVAAPLPAVNAGDRWYVLVEGRSGDGLYNLQFSIS